MLKDAIERNRKRIELERELRTLRLNVFDDTTGATDKRIIEVKRLLEPYWEASRIASDASLNYMM